MAPVRLAIFGDLHLEFQPYTPPPLDVDLVVLAGDMHLGAGAIPWAAEAFPGFDVVYVAGNHEFYHRDITATFAEMRAAAAATENVRFLEDDEVVFQWRGRRVRVLGAMLWMDFCIDGPEAEEAAHQIVGGRLNDFRLIALDGRPFTTHDAKAIHVRSRAWLDREMAKPFDGETVVVTHHAPSLNSVAPHSRINNPAKAGFASDLDSTIMAGQPALWVHGHTHHNVDYRMGRTRVVARQRGYPAMQGRPEENPGFEPLVVEI